jgi:hypothetical protein
LIVFLPFQEFADSYDIPFIETSAKTAHNVEKCFVQMATSIKNRCENRFFWNSLVAECLLKHRARAKEQPQYKSISLPERRRRRTANAEQVTLSFQFSRTDFTKQNSICGL